MAGVLGVIAVFSLLISVLAVWARNTLSDGDKMVAAVDKALDQPAVIDELATRITTEVFTVVDVEALIKENLPGPLGILAPSIVGGAETVVQNGMVKVLSADATQDLITAIVKQSHASLMRLLRGDGLVSGITVTDGAVTVNLLPLVSRGLQLVQDNTGLLSSKDIPELTVEGDPSAQIAELEQAFNRDLPDDFGQLVVYQSANLEKAGATVSQAQQLVVFARRAIAVAILLTIVCFAAAIAFAARRRRTVVILLLSSAAVLLVARVVVRRAVEKIPTLITDPGARQGAAALITALSNGLVVGVTLLAFIGLIAAAIAYLTGPGARAVAFRERVGASAGKGGSIGGFINAHRDAVAIMSFGVAVALILFTGIGSGQLLIGLLLAGFGVWAMVAPGRVEVAEAVDAAPPAG